MSEDSRLVQQRQNVLVQIGNKDDQDLTLDLSNRYMIGSICTLVLSGTVTITIDDADAINWTQNKLFQFHGFAASKMRIQRSQKGDIVLIELLPL
jgi:hypothetical protein